MPRTVTTRKTYCRHLMRLRDCSGGLRPLASADGAELIACHHRLEGVGRSGVRTEA